MPKGSDPYSFASTKDSRGLDSDSSEEILDGMYLDIEMNAGADQREKVRHTRRVVIECLTD